jgi:surface antigen
MMRRLLRQVLVHLVLTAAVAAGAAPSIAAGGLVDPFGLESYNISAADWDLLKQAVRKVLEEQRPGATATWQGKKSGRAGRATLLKVFTRNGLPCGEVEHVFTAGGGSRYVLPFCRIADGTWKVAF